MSSGADRSERISRVAPNGVRVWLLGGFRVSVGQRVIEADEWRLRKAASLLKLLALAQGHRLHRERVMDLLWPDLGHKAAENGLRRVLHSARRTLEPDPVAASRYLHLRGDLLALCPNDPLWVDAEAFAGAGERARRSREPSAYRAAIELYRGDLLPEDRYEIWAEERREGLRLSYLELLVELAGLYEGRNELGLAVEALRKVVSEEPAHEGAHAGLMRLYAGTGQRHQALRQYERLREALRQELDAEPGAASRHLYEEILAGRTPTAELPPVSSSSEEPPEADGRHNLPRSLTSFVGREHDVMEVERLLDTTHLLTLTGTGGSGKTRLALEVARNLADSYPDGTWLVELAPLAEGALVPQAVAAALGISERPGRPLTDVLVEALRERQMLLVLDNCEHLVDTAARLIETLLLSCPGLRILATSRELLGARHEVTWPVPPLSGPDPNHRYTVEEVANYESVRLFVERVQSRDPAFVLTTENIRAVTAICERLDGIPLAIELAAARVGTLTVAEISERLGDSLQLLTGGSRTATRRQRTLRGALDWSYDLLSEPERMLFRKLSVFAGGWTLAAAEAVGVGSGIEEGDILDLLSRLVDKSLAITGATGDGGVRFGMLEPVRQYAQERLEESGEGDAVRRRHAEFFLALAEEAEPELMGTRQGAWLERLQREHDNFRAALSWSLDVKGTEPEERAESGLRLATALARGRFWTAHAPREGLEWLEKGLATSSTSSASVRAKALNEAGHIAVFRDGYQKLVGLLDESFALCMNVGDEAGAAFTLSNLLQAAYHLGNREQAEMLGRKAETLLEEVTDRRAIAYLLLTVGIVAVVSGNHERGLALLEESLAMNQELGDVRGIAQCLTVMWVSALQQGKYHWAATLLKQDLRILQELRDKVGTAYALLGSGAAASSQGHPARAARLWGASEALREVTGLHLSPFVRTSFVYDRCLNAARSQLDETSWEAAWAEGRAMTQEQAVEYALSEEELAPVVTPAPEESSTGEQPSILTRREEEVAVLISRGLTNRQISAELAISERTADAHVRKILKKLGFGSRAQVAAWVAEQ